MIDVVVHTAMVAFVDTRDSGAVFVTHLYLLAGCAIPLQLAAVSCVRHGALAGLLSIGLGDAVASIFGTRFVEGFVGVPGTCDVFFCL